MDISVKACGKDVQLGQGSFGACGDKWGQSIIQCEFCKGWQASRVAIEAQLEIFEEWFEVFQDTGYRCGVSVGAEAHDYMERAWEASRELLNV